MASCWFQQKQIKKRGMHSLSKTDAPNILTIIRSERKSSRYLQDSPARAYVCDCESLDIWFSVSVVSAGDEIFKSAFVRARPVAR